MSTRLPVFVLGLAALGACASVPAPEGPPLATHADRHRIEVTQTSERVEIPVAPGDVALASSVRPSLRNFAAGYLQYGHGALVLSTPSGGDNTEAATLVSQEARRALIDLGISYAAVASSSYDAAGRADAPIILSFSRYEAQAPECAPLWQQDLGHQSNNQPWESFGCSMQANLAAMVEDPADLLHPRTMDPRDSDRRDTVMEAYRAGEQTHATRSADERVTISNAIQ